VARLVRCAIPFLLGGVLLHAEHFGYVRSGKRPIPGATITASLEDRKLATTTDETGRYYFDNLGRGKWVFQVQMFGFTDVRQELALVDGVTVADFDLELQAAAVPDQPATPAVGFQTINVTEQVDQTQIEQQLETASAPLVSELSPASDLNESFLVSGSLSGGLQAVGQQDFFDQADDDLRPVKNPARGASAPGKPRSGPSARNRRWLALAQARRTITRSAARPSILSGTPNSMPLLTR